MSDRVGEAAHAAGRCFDTQPQEDGEDDYEETEHDIAVREWFASRPLVPLTTDQMNALRLFGVVKPRAQRKIRTEDP